MINFDSAKNSNLFYEGDAGAKQGVEYGNAYWMLKFPKSTRDLIAPQISYTTSPLSEYLGSQIYKSLSITVQETVLGICRNKLVVACKDFTYEQKSQKYSFIPFNALKNTYMSSNIESFTGSGSSTLLGEVLDTLSGLDILVHTTGATERFWDMFIVDAFIGNNDRNNGNWGILRELATGDISLAPVFDNGNAFFNKKGILTMENSINNVEMLRNDAIKNPTCTFEYENIDGKTKKINPFSFISNIGENIDCDKAVIRFIDNLDMNKIYNIIDEVPETFGHLLVITSEQKEYYKAILNMRLNEVFLPISKKLKIQ